MNQEVEYRDIPGFPGYRVGNDGSVWSSHWPGPKTLGCKALTTPRWKKMTPTPHREGYVAVCLRAVGRKRSMNVHRLVAMAFLGPCPEGMEVAHENGIRTDNRLCNLSYKTRSANQRDRKRHGTDDCGERSVCAKLTAERVRQLRERYAAGGVTQRTLAVEYGVTQSTVMRIVKRRQWAHLT